MTLRGGEINRRKHTLPHRVTARPEVDPWTPTISDWVATELDRGSGMYRLRPVFAEILDNSGRYGGCYTPHHETRRCRC